MTQEAQSFTLKNVLDLRSATFIVEKYQRGYKWEIRQVEELLDDIAEFDLSKQSFYCLQPVVVKDLGNETYELIDGQQRLTSIYIILSLLAENELLEDDESAYKIEYRTRLASKAFLEEIDSLKDWFEHSIHFSKKTVVAKWESYITNNPSKNNVDNYHFFTAYNVANQWMHERSEDEITEFKSKLLYHTKVIWYNIKTSQSAENVFINFNQGKIELAQAELIKALFVLSLKQESDREIQNIRINQFAQEWNSIENQLQHDEFWHFVSNDTSDKRKANRIDFLFDIVSEKPPKNPDELYAYRTYLEKYQKAIRSDAVQEDPLGWNEVKSLFEILLEWYEDREIYHLIGFIIHEDIMTIKSIVKAFNAEQNKSAFKKTLIDRIREAQIIKKKLNIEEIVDLRYDEPRDKPIIHSLLLLFNVITYQNSDVSYRFPFHAFKKSTWSLEHIHAQNADAFKTVEEVKGWLADLKQLEKDYNKEMGQQTIDLDFSTVEELLERDINEIDRELRNAITDLEVETNNRFVKHGLENLCLLDTVTNSHFNNDGFSSKRSKLIAIDKGNFKDESGAEVKAFIPIATKNVFLKYYSKNDDSFQIVFWGYKDRIEYIQQIKSVLSDYLKLKPEAI